MELSIIDVITFLVFVGMVVFVSLYKSKNVGGSEDYFLAGRGLSWWLIGFSLIAANISTEQFVGMSGQAANYVGLAIASYEWMAAITLVVVAFIFLPKFLKTGIYTIPEFLKYRYNETSRSIMAGFTMIIYVFVTIAAVIYSGALMANTLFPYISVAQASWIIGALAALYVMTGGLKACAWADLLQGSALIAGGGIITYFAFSLLGRTPIEELAFSGSAAGVTNATGAWSKFMALNSDKMHMKLPASDSILPWTALVVGLWIPNFYYWGLNQYITQRTLGSKSLSQGQKGIVFAAAMKLIIPFIIVFPGIIAFNLFSGKMADAAAVDNRDVLALYEKAKVSPNSGSYLVFKVDEDWKKLNREKAAEIEAFNAQISAAASGAGAKTSEKGITGYKHDTAFGLLIQNVLPAGRGLQGFVLAAILGAVVSSLASMLNSASTIFTMDIFRKYINKEASQKTLVAVGRICVGIFVVIGCIISPQLGDPAFRGIFTYIQEFQGFISPGILAVFIFGLIAKKAPPVCGVVGLLLNPLMYGLLKVVLPGLAFLDRMAVSFFCVMAVMGIITWLRPLSKPVELPTNTTIDLESSKFARMAGWAVVAATLMLYVIFW